MFGQGKILNSISKLPKGKQLAFGLMLWERMLPALSAFSKDTGFDDTRYLQGRDAAWAALRGRGNHTVADERLRQDCHGGAPDTEVFSHELTSYALNAALGMSDLLEFIFDEDMQHLAHLLSLAADSVDLFVGGIDLPSLRTSGSEWKMAAEPIMQLELSKEEEDLAFIAGLPERLGREEVSALRARASSQTPLLPHTP